MHMHIHIHRSSNLHSTVFFIAYMSAFVIHPFFQSDYVSRYTFIVPPTFNKVSSGSSDSSRSRSRAAGCGHQSTVVCLVSDRQKCCSSSSSNIVVRGRSDIVVQIFIVPHPATTSSRHGHGPSLSPRSTLPKSACSGRADALCLLPGPVPVLLAPRP